MVGKAGGWHRPFAAQELENDLYGGEVVVPLFDSALSICGKFWNVVGPDLGVLLGATLVGLLGWSIGYEQGHQRGRSEAKAEKGSEDRI